MMMVFILCKILLMIHFFRHITLLGEFNSLISLHANPNFEDIDGDGALDLIIGVQGGIIRYFKNDNISDTIAFTEQTGINNPFNNIKVGNFNFMNGIGKGSSSPTFVDVDGDDDSDLIVGQGNGKLHYYQNNAGVYSELTGGSNPFDSIDVGNFSKPVFSDIDGDNDLDLLVGAKDGFCLLLSQ